MASADKIIIPGIQVQIEELSGVQSRLSGLSLRNMRQLNAAGSGARQTRIRGRGMEYEESRAYIVGDDVKALDWRVMARTGEPHTKVFAEEKERSYLVAIDLSSSMFFGTRFAFKSWAAAQVAAHVGWLATISGDRLGGIVVTKDAMHAVRPGKTRAGLMSIFHSLVEASDIDLPVEHGESRLNFLLAELKRSEKRGSIVVLISDFLGVDSQTIELFAALSRRNDMIAFWIYDKTETETWLSGSYPLRSEKQKFIVDTSKVSGSDWLLRQQEAHRSQIESLTSRFGIALFPVSCNRDIGSQLIPYLKR